MPPSRVERRYVGAWMDAATHQRIKILAAQRSTSIQALVEEALRDLLEKEAG